MLTNQYLLFTDNYVLAQLEVLLLGGIIKKKIADQMFFVSIPVSIDIQKLQYSTTEIPEEICNIALCILAERINKQCNQY